MPYPKPTNLTSWSYSRYGTYAQCPLKAKLSYIDKLPQTKNAAMARGNDIHKLAEQYLKGEIRTIPPELKKFEKEIKEIRALAKKRPDHVLIEQTWALKADWTETTWDDWTGCWLRIKTDLAHFMDVNGHPVVTVTDWKTGKYRPDNQDDYIEQLDLYALGALIKWEHLIPNGLEVRPRLVYLDAQVIYPGRTYSGADLPILKKDWAKRVKPMLADKKFAPKPNQWCPWCDYSKAKNGPCVY